MKCFPILLQYFRYDEGVQHVLLDFYDDSDESSEAISKQLVTKLEKHGLSLQNVSAYTADNASVNYGKHNSVFRRLKNANPSIIPANCLAHVLHNASRHASLKLKVDVENTVMKIFSHFSVSAKRTAVLQDFCEFVDSDRCNLLRHVITRWLSLLPAIERVISFWSALKSYFQSLGEDNCPNALWQCFGNDQAIEVHEIYFLFLSHALKIFADAIRTLESKSFSVTTVHAALSDLKAKIERRIADSYFGFATVSKLEQLHPDLNRKCTSDFVEFYKRALKYVSERYDFSEQSFHARIAKLSLESGLSFSEFSSAVKHCNLENINMDELYEEFAIIEKAVKSFDFESISVQDRYIRLFEVAAASLKNLMKVSSFIFSIPCSNAHTERVFSLMNTAWRDERNRMKVATVKAELQVC